MSVVRFPLPSDSSKWVDLKGEWTYGDTKAITKASGGAPSEIVGAVDASAAVLERFILGWNLADDSGHILPLGTASIDAAMKEEDAMAVVKQCISLRPEPPSPNP